MKASSTRYRWFTLRPFDSKMLRRLSEGMLLSKFEDEASFGYILGDVRKDKLTGKFVQKDTINRIITNAQGESETVQFVDFNITNFTISTSHSTLEVVNPSRRLSELLISISDILDNRIAIIPIAATCRTWLDALSKSDCTIRLTKIVTGHISLTDTVSVKATFSGTKNIQKEAKTFLKGKMSDPVEITGQLEHDGDIAKIKITSSGALCFLSSPSEGILSAVRAACDMMASNGSPK